MFLNNSSKSEPSQAKDEPLAADERAEHEGDEPDAAEPAKSNTYSGHLFKCYIASRQLESLKPCIRFLRMYQLETRLMLSKPIKMLKSK